MKSLIFSLFCSLLFWGGQAQNITRITLANPDLITCEVDRTLMINLSKEGTVISFGTEDNWGADVKLYGPY